jgi:hypothetical protein
VITTSPETHVAKAVISNWNDLHRYSTQKGNSYGVNSPETLDYR